MLSALHLITLAQLPVTQAGQLLLVTALAFAIITLICSTVRFHKLIQCGEDELKTVDDCNDFFFIQVTRYLSKINRTSSGFGIIVVQFQSNSSDLRPRQEQLLELLKKTIRKECDKACLFHSDCVAAIVDTEEENVEAVSKQIIRKLNSDITSIPDITAIRAGASSFPTHGLTTRELIDCATAAVEQASFDGNLSFKIAETPQIENDEAVEEEAIGELSKKDKNSSLDPLTGVLKPEVIASYMRKYLSEIRQKKNPAAVLSIRINRIDNIIALNGEAAADTVIAGVSEVIQRLTRDSDLIGRYGKTEFLLLAPCTLEQGEMIATRLREAVQKESFIFNGKPLKASISAGISGHPEHGRTLRELFKASNTALNIVQQWGTTACLVFDPVKHSQDNHHEKPAQARR